MTTTIPSPEELQSIFDNILDNPKDLSLRLIYADALEDFGNYPLSTFIRLQINRFKEKKVSLSKQEKLILSTWGNYWVALPLYLQQRQLVGDFRISWRWSRGFIYYLRCPYPIFHMYKDSLLQTYPLECLQVSSTSTLCGSSFIKEYFNN